MNDGCLKGDLKPGMDIKKARFINGREGRVEKKKTRVLKQQSMKKFLTNNGEMVKRNDHKSNEDEDGKRIEPKKEMQSRASHQADDDLLGEEVEEEVSRTEAPMAASEAPGFTRKPDPHHHLDLTLSAFAPRVQWRNIKAENLNLEYAVAFPREIADALVKVFENELEYFTGRLAQVQVYGKLHNIPRKQTVYGDDGLVYTYSGVSLKAKPWTKTMAAVKDYINLLTGYHYNFVLVNRYKDGEDRMGEHKDDEKELDPGTPIASVSLGQPRDFYFKHQDARTKAGERRNIPKVSMELEHGSLLLMKFPTNKYWYHALPPRKSAKGIRINLTFRRILQ